MSNFSSVSRPFAIIETDYLVRRILWKSQTDQPSDRRPDVSWNPPDESGSEIHRVEDTMIRIAHSQGNRRLQCFSDASRYFLFN